MDHELRVGALAHFEDPAYYAHTYARRTADILHYVELAKKARGPVLEYGIGNGRIAIPTAREGVTVFGVDHSRPMLRDLAQRLRGEPADVRARVHGRFGDMRRVALRKRFPLVIAPFNVLLHLYTRPDVERFLAVVQAHLAPSGLFAFDVLNPDLAWLSRDPRRRWARTRFRHPRTGRMMVYSTSLSYDAALQIAFMRIYYETENGGRARVVRLAHRQFFPVELAALLHYNGFAVEAHEGGFDGQGLVPESEEQVLRCRSRRGISLSRRKKN